MNRIQQRARTLDQAEGVIQHSNRSGRVDIVEGPVPLQHIPGSGR